MMKYYHNQSIGNLFGILVVVISNQISNVQPLSGLYDLTKLDLQYNQQINDLTPLSNLAKLRDLWLDGNQISSISPLENLNNLSSLRVIGNPITDFSPLSNLTQLQHLLISGDYTQDLTPIESFMIQLKRCHRVSYFLIKCMN